MHNSWALIWRGALLLCVFMASKVLLQERADLAAIFSILSLAFVVLFSSSLQFDCRHLYQQYSDQANCLLLVIGVVWCLLQQALAQKKPAHYALVWMVITGVLLSFY